MSRFRINLGQVASTTGVCFNPGFNAGLNMTKLDEFGDPVINVVDLKTEMKVGRK